jgi:hypothetical protein
MTGSSNLYRLNVAAKVIGWNLLTLRDYFTSGIFQYCDEDKKAHSRGASSYLSFNSVVRLAIVFELHRIGIAPKRAFEIALQFSDFSSPDNCRCLLPVECPMHPVSHRYDTYLVVKPAPPPVRSSKNCQDRTYLAEIVRNTYGDGLSIEDINHAFFKGTQGPTIVVDVYQIWFRVSAALNVRSGVADQ